MAAEAQAAEEAADLVAADRRSSGGSGSRTIAGRTVAIAVRTNAMTSGTTSCASTKR